MITQDILEACVIRAGLTPTVHNTQPARWVRDGDVLSLFCDTNVGLSAADPTGRDAALSCGAVLEGMVLALSAYGIAAMVTLTGKEINPNQGLVAVAHLTLSSGGEDGLNAQLEQRFTWRGAFDAAPVELYGWTRPDARLIFDAPGRTWLAQQNDVASLAILQSYAFRHELLNWMRLNDAHPRAGLDGMHRSAMGMSKRQARFIPYSLIKFWGILNGFGLTKGLVSEEKLTLTAPFIALFHRDISENSIASGRAYLRMCLEAASLGLAGWPMAALGHHPDSHGQVVERFGIPSDRRLVQAIRFGVPTGDAPPRARRPVSEILR